jgi:hypothetical protein
MMTLPTDRSAATNRWSDSLDGSIPSVAVVALLNLGLAEIEQGNSLKNGRELSAREFGRCLSSLELP